MTPETMECGNPEPDKGRFPVSDSLTFQGKVFRRSHIELGCDRNEALLKRSTAQGGSLDATLETRKWEVVWLTNLDRPTNDVAYYFKAVEFQESRLALGGDVFGLAATSARKVPHG